VTEKAAVRERHVGSGKEQICSSKFDRNWSKFRNGDRDRQTIERERERERDINKHREIKA
jgi:hypothetical protein